MNVFRTSWGRALIVASGLRSKSNHQRSNPSLPKSKHLLGQAVDIPDLNGDLYQWLKDNVGVLKNAEIFCEEGAKG